MSELQALADRVAIEALTGEFTDARLMLDYDRLASLFAADGELAIPDAGIKLEGRDVIRSSIERMADQWEFFVQTTHLGWIQVDGDTAVGRAYIHEFGAFPGDKSHQNYSRYHDRYQRTPDGWKFASRVYEIMYHDESPLLGTPGGMAGMV